SLVLSTRPPMAVYISLRRRGERAGDRPAPALRRCPVGPLGVPELIILAPLLLLPTLFIVGAIRRAKRLGYPSIGAYLRAAPRTDEEKRDAADMAMKGLVLALLGL